VRYCPRTNLKVLKKTTESLGYDCRYAVGDKNKHIHSSIVVPFYCSNLHGVLWVLWTIACNGQRLDEMNVDTGVLFESKIHGGKKNGSKLFKYSCVQLLTVDYETRTRNAMLLIISLILFSHKHVY